MKVLQGSIQYFAYCLNPVSHLPWFPASRSVSVLPVFWPQWQQFVIMLSFLQVGNIQEVQAKAAELAAAATK
jgi:hypothetical protein